ncbi:MAG: hypothetical protein ABIN01_03160 [Ferruginibacter sp.]
MKKQSISLFTSLSEADITNITTPVKETIALGFVAPRPKIFTAAELWNIQRLGKARVQRRFL